MPSSDTPGNPPLIRGKNRKMPSVAWFPHGQHKGEFFLILNPVGKYKIFNEALNLDTVVFWYKRIDIAVLYLLIAMAFVFPAAVVISAEAVGHDEVFAPLFPGSAIGFLVAAFFFQRKMVNRAKSPDNSLMVTMKNQQAWRLCSTVAKLGRVASWADGTVDTARQAPSILWSAVGRSITLDQQYAEATEALELSRSEEFEPLSLGDLAKKRLSKVDQERQSLNAVEANLNQVLKTAVGIDRRRVRVAEEKKEAAQRQRKARELRDRLDGYNAIDGDDTTVAPQVSDAQADRSAGLAAETKFIADLLAECDRMLRESDD
ncbi:MAG: hypothetical protein ACRDTF_20690 [Pseudonocardiaceae bacterium]